MELVDKTFTMEENQQEYFDRCEELFQGERNFIKSILKQCTKENLVEHFALYGNTEYNKTVFHYKLPSGLHIYANNNRIADKYYDNLTGGIFILANEISPETAKHSMSFLQLADGADSLIQWGEAGTGPLAATDCITYRVNCHSQKRYGAFECTSDIRAGFRSTFTNGKNHHVISSDQFGKPMNLKGNISSLQDLLHEVVGMSELSDDEKEACYDKFLPLQKMLEIERAQLREEKSNNRGTALQQREAELSSLEAEAKVYDEELKSRQQDGKSLGEE